MMKEKYIELFIDQEYPFFLDRYLKTKTLSRLQSVGQFCGCDYTTLYDPLFFYSRYDHSLVVAHMVWHFTHDKKETIIALLHDIGTPCFAHSIDYVLGDFESQESSEKEIFDVIKGDLKLLQLLKEDHISSKDFLNLSDYSILENKSPKLCADRLDGVLHTCFIWLKTHSLQEVKEVYDSILILENEDQKKELGFCNPEIGLKFVKMVEVYARELQSSRNKYTMKYVSDVVLLAIKRNLISFEDLYQKKEEDFVTLFSKHMNSWRFFEKAKCVLESKTKPKFYTVYLQTKKRNVLPLCFKNGQVVRINDCSDEARKIYQSLFLSPLMYAYVNEMKEVN